MIPERAVIDTNVGVSGILTRVPVSPTARILDGMLMGRFRFLLSIELLAEYREVFLRPLIRRRHRMSAGDEDLLLTEVAANGIALEITRPASARRRRSDDHIWELVAAGKPALLVTGDKRLIEQPVEGTRVMTARAFAELLEE